MINQLTEEQRQIVNMAQRFAKTEIAADAQRMDATDQLNLELISKCAELGLFGLYTDEAYGGLGKSLLTSCLVLEEIAKESPALAGLLNVEIVLCPAMIDVAGTEEQKQRFLPPSASGEALLAISQVEPAGGGNISMHQTRLTPTDGGYLLNGSKLFCTQGSARYVMVMTKTEELGQLGYGCALIDLRAEGVSVAAYEHKLGWRGTNTGGLSFTDVFVPPENIIGNLLSGVKEMSPANTSSYLGHSASSLGAVQGLLERTIEYVKERKLYGLRMSQLQPISYWLADIFCKVEACRALLHRTARQIDSGQTAPLMGSICKGYICDAMFECSSLLLQMWGGSGMMDSTGVNRYFRDARINMMAEGATEMHYDIVSAAVLEHPPVLAGS